MKILIINTFYYPNMIGGTEQSVKILAEGLSKKGNQVYVLTIDSMEKKSIKEEINGVTVYRLYSKNFDVKARMEGNKELIKLIKNKLIEIENKSIQEDIEKVLQDIKPDIVHTNNIYGISPVVWKTIKNNNIKCVHTIRDYWIVNPNGELPQKNNMLLKLYQRKFRGKTNFVNAVTAPSNFTLNEVLKFGYFKNAISKCIVNCTDVNIEETKKIIDLKANRTDNNIKFLYVGGLFKIKGIYNLINAFSQIDKENIQLTICGDGDLKHYIEESSKKDNRIIYKGKLPKEELKKVWNENDVLIVPSIWDEPFGRVVIEANQHGLPVIGSNKGGIKETLEKINTGEIFQFDDIESLKDKILYFCKRENIKKYYDSIIKNIEIYSEESQIREFIKLYQKMV